MAILDLNQVSTAQFMNARCVWGEYTAAPTEFFAVGQIDDLIHGNRYSKENKFNNHVSFVLTLAEAEALTKNRHGESWTRCYAPTLKDALDCIRERNDALLVYFKEFSASFNCEFQKGSLSPALGHYVDHYPQKLAA